MFLHLRDQIFKVLGLLGYEFLVGLLEISDLVLIVELFIYKILNHCHVELVVAIERSCQGLDLLFVN